jgi:hypothetical protein
MSYVSWQQNSAFMNSCTILASYSRINYSITNEIKESIARSISVLIPLNMKKKTYYISYLP